VRSGLFGAAVVIVVVVAVVAARDMNRRGRNGELYAIAVLFVPPLGLLMWGLDRRRPPVVPGPRPEVGPDPAVVADDALPGHGGEAGSEPVD